MKKTGTRSGLRRFCGMSDDFAFNIEQILQNPEKKSLFFWGGGRRF